MFLGGEVGSVRIAEGVWAPEMRDEEALLSGVRYLINKCSTESAALELASRDLSINSQNLERLIDSVRALSQELRSTMSSFIDEPPEEIRAVADEVAGNAETVATQAHANRIAAIDFVVARVPEQTRQLSEALTQRRTAREIRALMNGLRISIDEAGLNLHPTTRSEAMRVIDRAQGYLGMEIY